MTAARLAAVAAAAALLGCASPAGPGDGAADAGATGPAADAASSAAPIAPADGGDLAGAPPPAPAPGGGPAAAPPLPDAGAPTDAPPPVPVTAAFAAASGADVALPLGAETTVDPAARFRVEVAASLVDGRLSLHDAGDAMVASSGTAEIAAARTRYTLAPEEPLAPGSSYALRVDGAVTREAHDPAGRAYAPVLVRIRTAGDKPPPKKAAPAPRRRVRRAPAAG